MSTARASEQRERRRRQIIDAARAVFATRGYHNASIDDVIKRAGIARGTFYLYFPGKAEVFASLLEEEVAELRARIWPIDVARGAAPAPVQLREIVVGVLQHLLENREFTRLLLVLWMNPDVEVAESVDGFYERVAAVIRHALETGMRVGIVRRCDPALVGAALLGAARGIVGRMLATRRPPPVERVADELIALVLQGVGAQ